MPRPTPAQQAAGMGLVGASGTSAVVNQIVQFLAEQEAKKNTAINQDLASRRVGNEEQQTANQAIQFDKLIPFKQGELDINRGQLQLGQDVRGDRLAAGTAQTTAQQQALTNLHAFIDDPNTPEPQRQLARARLAGLDVNSVNDIGMAPEKPAPPDSFTPQDVMVDGKPMRVNFNPHTGKYTDVQTGQVVTGNIQDVPKPQTGQEKLIAVLNPDGTTEYVPQSQAAGRTPAPNARRVLGAERQSLAYYNRAKDAADAIANLEPEIQKMSLPQQAGMQYLPNFLQSQTGQSYRQAQRAFTEARLRKESGAAIPPQEYENDSRTYFAQPGDTAETLQRKVQARQKVLDGLAFSSGQAYEEFYGEPFKHAAGGPERKTLANGNVLEKQSDGTWKVIK